MRVTDTLKWLILWLIMGSSVAWARVPTIAVSHSAPERIAKGSPIQVAIDYQNAPEGAGLVIWVAPDVPLSEYDKVGAYPAPIVLAPVPVSGNGRHVIEWNGRDLGCAPLDAPTWCPDFEIGRYRFEAALYASSRFGLLGRVPRQPVEVLAHKHSIAFNATGTFNFERYRGLLNNAASAFLAKTLHLHSAGVRGLGAGETGLFLEARGNITKGPEGHCANYEGRPPFIGQVTACIPESAIGPYGVHPSRVVRSVRVTSSSKIATRPELLSYSDALAQARPLADAPYVARLNMESLPIMFAPLFERGADGVGRRIGDDVNSWGRGGRAHNERVQAGGVTNWSFDTAASAWIFVLYEIKAGGRETDADRFADNVMVRVEQSGKACVIETRPYQASFSEGVVKQPCP